MSNLIPEPDPPLELSTVVVNNQDNAHGNQTTLTEPEKLRSTLRIAAILVALSVRKSCTNINQSR